MGNGNGIRIDLMGTGHIQEAFVDGELLIESKVRSCQEQIRAFTQCHGHRFTGLDTKPLGGDGFCKDDTGALVPVASDGRRDQADVLFAKTDSAGRFPGKKRAIHIDMENESGNEDTSFNPVL